MQNYNNLINRQLQINTFPSWKKWLSQEKQEIFTYLFPWSPKKSWESFSARALVPMAIAQFTPSGDVVTSADNPHTTKAVASTRYFDLAGKLRTKPEKGVNIIVTTYTDGSTQVTKLLK